MSEELVGFFKALADANRLRIVGLLAQQPYSVEQLAAVLHLRPSTVSHHLSRLAEVGLVSARAEGYYSIYELQEDTLKKMRLQFSKKDLAAVAEEVDVDAYDRKVIEDFSYSDGRLKTIPAQRKKLEAVLRHVLQAFEPDVLYSEKQVNQILSRFYEDTASLRRELVGSGMMQRSNDGGAYWRGDAS